MSSLPPFTAADLKPLQNRITLASKPESWDYLKTVPLDTLCVLATNLSACENAGEVAVEAGFLEFLFNYDMSSLKAQKMFWQVMNNLHYGVKDLKVLLDPRIADVMEISLKKEILGSSCTDFQTMTAAENALVSDIIDKTWYFVSIFHDLPIEFPARMIQVINSCSSEDAQLALLSKIEILEPYQFLSLKPEFIQGGLAILEDRRSFSWQKLGPAMVNTINELCASVERQIESGNENNGDCTRLVVLLDNVNTIMLEKNYDFTPITTAVVTILKTTRKLPVVKLNDTETQLSFYKLRTSLLSALLALLNSNKETYELINRLDALPAVLDSTVIDKRNPYGKEQAILCLRYLLKDEANQRFVRDMQPIPDQTTTS